MRRFGVFELDLRAGELRRNGLKVKLQEQPFQVLALLLEKPGEVVTRDDLRKRLWPADTFVDFDHSLNAAIKRLRDALGDTAENPTFVETVTRRGYRFLAPVATTRAGNNDESAALALTGEISGAPPTPAPAKAFRLWWMAAASGGVILVLLGIKVGLTLAQRHLASEAHTTEVHTTQLTANPADDRVQAAAISRDGRYLAFSDETGFYLRQIDTEETHSIPLPAGLISAGITPGSISWFPDNAHMVVALTSSAGVSSLWEVSVLGGTAHKLSDEGQLPVVSADGKQIAYIAGNRMRDQVWVMAADGEQPHKLAGEEGDYFGALAWSPDGEKLAYTRGSVSHTYRLSGAVEVMDLRDRHVGNILRLNHMGWFSLLAGPLAWTGEGRLIYALAESPPRQLDSNLWSVALDPSGHPSSPPLRLTSDPGLVSTVSVAGDGKRIVYLKGLPQPDVYVAKVEGTAAISGPVRLTLDDRQDIPFDWSLDSKAVYFISDRTGNFSIYRQSIDQTVPELLVRGAGANLTPRLSPDGSQLLYLAYPNWTDNSPVVSLMRLPTAGGPPRRVLQANWISNVQCARAPATLCLYSVGTEGKFTVFSFDPLKGNSAQVYQIQDNVPELYNWSLSPDAGMLAITKWQQSNLKAGDSKKDVQEGEHSEIHLLMLKTGAQKRLTVPEWPSVGAVDWAADSKSMWAVSAADNGNTLLNIDLQGHAHPVWRSRKMSVYWAIPSRDGRYLALHVGSSSANVWMLERR